MQRKEKLSHLATFRLFFLRFTGMGFLIYFSKTFVEREKRIRFAKENIHYGKKGEITIKKKTMKNKHEYIGLIISVILFFGAILFREKNIKDSAIELLFILGMMMFNYGIVVIYQSLKKNNWNYSLAKNEYNYQFTNTGVIAVVILFILFLPSTLILFWIILSALLLFVLFIYDLIVNR